MLRTGLWATALTFALMMSTGCALQQGRTTFLKPSAVSPTFKDLDKDNPLAKGQNKVEIQKVGIASYDNFFRESAEIEGTVVLADVVLKEVDGFVARTKKELAGGKLTERQLQELERRQARVGEIMKLLTDVPGRSGTLVEKGEALSKNAGKTFVGPDALKLPGVVKGLQLSIASLREAGARSPKVLEHATKTSAALAGLS